MAVHIKSTKRQKREAVVPFDGEENFVVPKKGGFGQPDNENYVMVEGSVSGTVVGDTPRTPVADTPIKTTDDGSGGAIVTPPPIDMPPPQRGINIPYQDFSSMTCEQLKGYLSVLNGYSTTIQNFPAAIDRYNQEVANVKAAADTTCAVKVALPTFPNFSTMTCSELEQAIKDLEAQMSVSRYTPQVAEAYNNALATAKSLFVTKCSVAPPPPPPPPPPPNGGGVLITPLGGGIGISPIGGIGGGGGEETQAPPPPTEKKNNWWWILLIIGGVYLLTRKKSE